MGDEEEEEEEEVVVVVRCRRVTEGGRRGGLYVGGRRQGGMSLFSVGHQQSDEAGSGSGLAVGVTTKGDKLPIGIPALMGGRMDLGSICCVRKWRRKASMEIVGTAVGG